MFKKNSNLGRVLLCFGVAIALVVGIAVPASAETLNGYDIASYQAGIDNTQTEGDFVIPKATQGIGYTNPYWRTWADETLAAGKKLGLYHYASGGNATAEADHFVNEVGDYAGKAIFVLDWESYQNNYFGTSSQNQWIAEFDAEVYARTGQHIVVYASESVAYNLGVDNEHLWVAQYASNNDVSGYQTDIWRMSANISDNIAIRQYTSRGYIDGWSGALDLDIFYGGTSDWDTLANGSNANDPGEVQATYTYGIDVDGLIGYNSITAWQQQLNNGIVDGSISGQNSYCRKYGVNVTGYDSTTTGGSTLVTNIQEFLNNHGYPVDVDGYMGKNTIKGIQWMLDQWGYTYNGNSIDQDGYLGYITAVSLQDSLNRDLWE